MNVLPKLVLGLFLIVPGPGVTAEPIFARLAEGFTSKDRHVGIEAAQRLFSVPTFPGVCAALQAPRLVIVAPQPLRLVRGQWFSYNQLVILAVDAAGRALPPVPIAIEVEDIKPPVLNLRSDMTADPNGKVLAVRKGRFHFRFRALCEGQFAAAVVAAEVVEP